MAGGVHPHSLQPVPYACEAFALQAFYHVSLHLCLHHDDHHLEDFPTISDFVLVQCEGLAWIEVSDYVALIRECVYIHQEQRLSFTSPLPFRTKSLPDQCANSIQTEKEPA